MIKIPTMFVRDETVKNHPVVDQIKPECQWVLDGAGIATCKVDGTNVKVANSQLLKRQKPKDRDYAEASYVPCERTNPADKWAFAAFDAESQYADGVYELVGPKVQGNPYKLTSHKLISVVPPDPSLWLEGEANDVIDEQPIVRTFVGLRTWLSAHPVEGLVFHHPDGRLAKIKRRDFGLPWPVRK